MRSAIAGLLGVVFLAVLSGCAPDRPNVPAGPTTAVISEAEYRAAVDRVAVCLRDTGFDVGAPELEPNGWRWSFSVLNPTKLPTPEQSEQFATALDEAYATCAADLEKIEISYRRQHVVPAMERDLVMREFVECMHAVGATTITGDEPRLLLDEKVGDLPDDVANEAQVCLGRYAGLWAESIPG